MADDTYYDDSGDSGGPSSGGPSGGGGNAANYYGIRSGSGYGGDDRPGTDTSTDGGSAGGYADVSGTENNADGSGSGDGAFWGGDNGAPDLGSGSNASNNPYNYGNENFNPFNNPFGPQNTGGPANVAPPSAPAPQGFYNPVTGKGLVAPPSAPPQIAAYNPVTNKRPVLGGGPAAMSSFSAPKSQQANTQPTNQNQDSNSGGDDTCYDLVFQCDGPGPHYEGWLIFYDNKSSEKEVARFQAYAGSDDPEYWGPPVGTNFTLTSYISPALGYSSGGVSFKVNLDPSKLKDPNGNTSGPFFIFPLSNGTTTRGAIGIKGGTSELRKAQTLLKAAAKCHATLHIGGYNQNTGGYPPPPPEKNDEPVDVTRKRDVVESVPYIPVQLFPTNPGEPPPARPIPVPQIPKNPVVDKKAVTDKSKVVPKKKEPSLPKIDYTGPVRAGITTNPTPTGSTFDPQKAAEWVAKMIDILRTLLGKKSEAAEKVNKILDATKLLLELLALQDLLKKMQEAKTKEEKQKSAREYSEKKLELDADLIKTAAEIAAADEMLALEMLDAIDDFMLDTDIEWLNSRIQALTEAMNNANNDRTRRELYEKLGEMYAKRNEILRKMGLLSPSPSSSPTMNDLDKKRKLYPYYQR